MAKINVQNSGGGGGSLATGVLQLTGGAAMSSTLNAVTDQNNTASPLNLSTTSVQVTSPLRITTDDPSDFYLDCEDGSTNNRFSIKRNTASQQVNVDFASNPAGSTTIVGAIRTYVDGVNLSEVMTFREDGNVGIGTTTPNELLDVAKNQASPTRINITNTNAGGTSTLRFTNATGAAAALFENSSNQLTFQNNTNSGVLRFQTTNAGGTTLTAVTVTGDQNVGINTTSPTARLQVVGSGSTSATTSLLVQNSGGSNALKITDDLNTSLGGSLTIQRDATNFAMRLGNLGQINAYIDASTNNQFYLVDATFSNTFILNDVGISFGGGPTASAKVSVNSTTQGFLPPRMTNAQRAAITTPAIGLMVYCTDAVEGLYVYKSTGWTFVI